MTVRTRFAPSPTGYLHVGGARTALYSWLYARKNEGTFILRIEDTDLERSTEASTQAIFDGMQWLGLNYDEGPFYQTKRFDRYAEVAQQLLAEGKAYRCICSKDRLEALRTRQMANKEKPRYDGQCRNLNLNSTGESYVIRFRNPQEGEVIIDDQVRGTIVIQNSELDDLIIVRSDGTPTYNFTVIVDDWDMRITHVIRGDDHINNTPRQINILKALDAKLPFYAHVPMILGTDGKRLSKRHGAVSVMQYRDDGYLPEALLNYLVRLGWSHGDAEIFSIEEMIAWFDIKNLNKSPASFNAEKLLWLNQHYLKTSNVQHIVQHLAWHMERLGIDYQQGPSLEALVEVQRERAKTLVEMANNSRFFYQHIAYDESVDKHLRPALLPAFKDLLKEFQNLIDWSNEAIHKVVVTTAEMHQLKLGQLAQPLRVAITGGTVSPPIDATIYLLGKEKLLARLNQAINYIHQASS